MAKERGNPATELFCEDLQSDNTQQNELSSKALVGKIRTTKQLNTKATNEVISKAWVEYEELQILEIGQNMFLFNFYTEADRDDVLR